MHVMHICVMQVNVMQVYVMHVYEKYMYCISIHKQYGQYAYRDIPVTQTVWSAGRWVSTSVNNQRSSNLMLCWSL
jgi:hypothetical protein